MDPEQRSTSILSSNASPKVACGYNSAGQRLGRLIPASAQHDTILIACVLKDDIPERTLSILEPAPLVAALVSTETIFTDALARHSARSANNDDDCVLDFSKTLGPVLRDLHIMRYARTTAFLFPPYYRGVRFRNQVKFTAHVMWIVAKHVHKRIAGRCDHVFAKVLVCKLIARLVSNRQLCILRKFQRKEASESAVYWRGLRGGAGTPPRHEAEPEGISSSRYLPREHHNHIEPHRLQGPPQQPHQRGAPKVPRVPLQNGRVHYPQAQFSRKVPQHPPRQPSGRPPPPHNGIHHSQDSYGPQRRVHFQEQRRTDSLHPARQQPRNLLEGQGRAGLVEQRGASHALHPLPPSLSDAVYRGQQQDQGRFTGRSQHLSQHEQLVRRLPQQRPSQQRPTQQRTPQQHPPEQRPQQRGPQSQNPPQGPPRQRLPQQHFPQQRSERRFSRAQRPFPQLSPPVSGRYPQPQSASQGVTRPAFAPAASAEDFSKEFQTRAPTWRLDAGSEDIFASYEGLSSDEPSTPKPPDDSRTGFRKRLRALERKIAGDEKQYKGLQEF
ncbi:uncharacterized protein EI97DRAFT_444091 [Westerdykella ornata]|uniref:Uncharacterized protein n=1 Tax=Westerdykella ornata TaxID=318751 RepID=A0A6A6JGI4_WESOR|nr:uncharacterized protein EI97DRAFT_444091 [Westerdykella ornata]KAF2274329.1 hypothetical protein EI97DRAFT_444091 [Westerdykella ornata]